MNTRRIPEALSVLKLFAIILVVAGAGGCATIVKGTSQKVPIASDPPGADILVDGSRVGQTPMAVEMKRKHDHLVTIQKTGYRPQSVAVVKDVGGAVWGNIIAGGLIGWGVDATSGAQYNLVPKTLSVRLESEVPTSLHAGNDDQAIFVSRLKALDQMRESKQISDEEYAKGRLELFRRYMPEVLPPDPSQSVSKEQ